MIYLMKRIFRSKRPLIDFDDEISTNPLEMKSHELLER